MRAVRWMQLITCLGLAAATAPASARERVGGGAPVPVPEAWMAGEPSASRPLPVEPLAIVGADIHPVARRPIPRGILLLEDGRIRAVLPEGSRIPKRYRVLPAQGWQAWPGFVAAGADGIGLTDDAWAGGQDAMLARGIAESFDPWSDQVELAASAGITTMLTWRSAPQPKGPLAGRAAILKMSVREPRGALVTELGGALAAPGILGPEGRSAAREAIEQARSGPRKVSGAQELWRALARREAPLIGRFESAADILAATELARELDVQLLLMTPAEAWPLAALLAREGVGVVQNVRHTWGKPRANRRLQLPGGWRFDAVSVLHDAGVVVAVAPDSHALSPWGVAGRDLLDLPMEAAFAVRAGLSGQEAIEAITLVPARLLGIEERVGSLEVGKDADVVLLDGDPLDYRSLVRVTIVSGRVVHDASRSRYWRGITALRDEALRDGRQQP